MNLAPTGLASFRRAAHDLLCRWTEGSGEPKQSSETPVLELRVHGVHATSPHSMLGVKAEEVRAVAGDGITGIHRLKEGVPVPLRNPPANVALEAYSWGGLTSGARGTFGWATRVLWLFLLPFALANLSYWARPELDFPARSASAPGSDESPDPLLAKGVHVAVYGARVVRVAAGLLTIFFVLTPLTVGVDLVAWQCYQSGSAGCPALPDGFNFLANPSFDESPQRRLAVGALPALLTILVIWLLARQSLARYESVIDPSSEVPPDTLPNSGLTDATETDAGLILRHRCLWSATARTQRLRRLHCTIALSLISCYVSVPVIFGSYVPTDDSLSTAMTIPLWEVGGLYPWLVMAGGAVSMLMLVGAVVVLARTRPLDVEYTGNDPIDLALESQRKRNLRTVIAAVFVCLFQLTVLAVGPSKVRLFDDGSTLPGSNLWFLAAFVLLTGLTVPLGLVRHVGRFASSVIGLIVLIALLLSNWPYSLPGATVRRDIVEGWPESPLSGVKTALAWLDGVAAAHLTHVIAVVVVFALVPLLLGLRVQTELYYRPSRSLAWRGAAPQVFLGAAVWIGLLFTTSAATFIANVLNGEQAVSALSVPDVAAEGAAAQPAQLAQKVSGDVVVTGPVTLSGASVALRHIEDQTTITVISGRVVVDSFRYPKQPDGVALSSRPAAGATFTLPEGVDTLSYTQTCIDDGGLAKAGAAQEVARSATTSSSTDACAEGTRQDGTLLLGTVDEITVGEAVQTLQSIRSMHMEVRLDGLSAFDAPAAPVEVSPVMRSRMAQQNELFLPLVLVWAPMVQLVLVLGMMMVVILCWCMLHWWTDIPEQVDNVVNDTTAIDATHRSACKRARKAALFPHRAEALVGYVGWLTAVLSLATILGVLTEQPPWTVLPNLLGFDSLEPWIRWVSGLAFLVSLGSALALVALASKLRKSDDARKTAGILWDLTTFWPRAAHPFAPPCYAERVVPELLTRIHWALEPPAVARPPADPSEPPHAARCDERQWGGAKTVILSAHSQGSTIAVAAASRLTDSQLRSVRLITYGSQLRTWYGRIFPAVFGPSALGYAITTRRPKFREGFPDVPEPAAVADIGAVSTDSLRHRIEVDTGNDEVPHWVNLFRRTDPIGFRVFTDQDHTDRDRPVLEVPALTFGHPGPAVAKHGGYPHSPEYRSLITAWTGEEVMAPDAKPVASTPSLPEP